MSGRLHPNRRLVSMKPRSAFWLSLIRVFALVVPLSLILSFATYSGAMAATGTPTIQSDQTDYAPGATVTVTGTNWDPAGDSVHIFVNDSVGSTWSYSADVPPAADGTIIKSFTLPSTFIATYSVTATQNTTNGALSAATSFTDTNVSVNPDDCNNGSLASPDTTPCQSNQGGGQDGWGQGNLTGNNSHWKEGDAFPVRLGFTGLTPGSTYGVTIGWDTTNSGKHAFDYLTTYDYSVPGARPDAAYFGAGGGAPSDIQSIPIDPLTSNQASGQHFAAWGDQSGSLSVASPGTGVCGSSAVVQNANGYVTCGDFTNNSTTYTKLSFSAGSGDTVVLSFALHIASRADWGFNNSAISISGSPYHFQIAQTFGFSSSGTKSLQIQTSAVIFPGQITIIKEAVPPSSTSFGFTDAGAEMSPGSFNLVDNSSSTDPQQVFGNLLTFPSTRTVTEGAVTNYALTFSGCTVTAPSGQTPGTVTTSTGTRTATFNLNEGDNATCTFINTLQTGTIEVKKVWVGPGGQTNLNIGTSIGGHEVNQTQTGLNGGAPLTTQAQAVTAGTYYVSESSGLTGYDSSLACTKNGSAYTPGANQSVTLATGDAVVCTFTNTRQASLNVIKNTTGGNGTFAFTGSGTGVSSSFNIATSGGTGQLGSPFGFTSSQLGTKTVKETVPSGWTLTNISCSGGENIAYGDGTTYPHSSFTAGDVAATIDVAAGDSASCTFTNTQNASLDLIKNTVGGDATFGFTGSGSGVGNTNITTVANTGHHLYSLDGTQLGTKTLSETVPAGWTLTSISCSGGTSIAYSSDGTSFHATFAQGDTYAHMTVGAGNADSCTFTNTKKGSITIIKDAIPNSSQAFQFHPSSNLSGSDFNLTDNGTPGANTKVFNGLLPDTYSVEEINIPAQWALAGINCGSASATRTGNSISITLAAGQNVTCTFTDTTKNLITDTTLCTFDTNSSQAGSQFHLLYTPDTGGYWKLNASNPGQFYYNVFDNGTPGTTGTVTLTLPYPWVTQGTVPLHVYNGATFTQVNGQTCIIPGNGVAGTTSGLPVTLSSYGSQTFGSQTTVSVTFTYPSTGAVYINLHVDYGLKTTTGWAKGSAPTNPYCPVGNDAINPLASPLPTILDCQPYTFSYHDGTSGSATVSSNNVFKKDPGIAGFVTRTSTFNPVVNTPVNIYLGSVLQATVYTDQDGWYNWQYKYTGKATTFTVVLPSFNNTSKSATLKSNAFLVVSFMV